MIYDDDLPIQDWFPSKARVITKGYPSPAPERGRWTWRWLEPENEGPIWGALNQELGVSQPKIMAFTAKLVILWYVMMMSIVKIWLKMMVNQFINHHHICPNMVDYDGFTSVKRTCQWRKGRRKCEDMGTSGHEKMCSQMGDRSC